MIAAKDNLKECDAALVRAKSELLITTLSAQTAREKEFHAAQGFDQRFLVERTWGTTITVSDIDCVFATVPESFTFLPHSDDRKISIYRLDAAWLAFQQHGLHYVEVDGSENHCPLHIFLNNGQSLQEFKTQVLRGLEDVIEGRSLCPLLVRSSCYGFDLIAEAKIAYAALQTTPSRDMTTLNMSFVIPFISTMMEQKIELYAFDAVHARLVRSHFGDNSWPLCHRALLASKEHVVNLLFAHEVTLRADLFDANTPPKVRLSATAALVEVNSKDSIRSAQGCVHEAKIALEAAKNVNAEAEKADAEEKKVAAAAAVIAAAEAKKASALAASKKMSEKQKAKNAEKAKQESDKNRDDHDVLDKAMKENTSAPPPTSSSNHAAVPTLITNLTGDSSTTPTSTTPPHPPPAADAKGGSAVSDKDEPGRIIMSDEPEGKEKAITATPPPSTSTGGRAALAAARAAVLAAAVAPTVLTPPSVVAAEGVSADAVHDAPRIINMPEAADATTSFTATPPPTSTSGHASAHAAGGSSRPPIPVSASPPPPLISDDNDDQLLIDYFVLGVNFFKEGNFLEAVKNFQIAADLGHADSKHNLALCHINGKGVAEDKKEGFKLFKELAEEGWSDSQHMVAVCYHKGIGVDIDTMEALKWYIIAEAKGHTHAVVFMNKLRDKEFELN